MSIFGKGGKGDKEEEDSFTKGERDKQAERDREKARKDKEKQQNGSK